MNLPSVEDMPFDHSYWITNFDEIEKVLNYNLNDVFSTNEFLNIALGKSNHPLYKGKNKIELRQIIAKKYKIPCLNWNDIKLGTELILKLYCEKFNKDPKIIRKLGTPRSLIEIKNCLPKWTNFKHSEFNKLLSFFKESKILNGNTKGILDFSLIFQNIKIDYGAGGAHACIKPGVYKSDENWIILDLDIDSMYPSLAISQKLYPEHLGLEFINIYDGEIVSVRLKEKKKPKKDRDFVIMEGFKLASNGTFGKTNEEKSWLYDPLYTMKTTISGQILISMWADRLVSVSPTLQILQINTDGITIRVLKNDYEKCISASEQLMKETSMSYEANLYKTMIIQDVNNYIAEYESGECKHKGLFEIDTELHKNPSMRIIPIALSNYFLKNISLTDTIRNHSNIYDFCLRLKINKGWEAIYKHIENDNPYLNYSDSQKIEIIKNNGWVNYYSNTAWIHESWIEEGKPYDRMATSLEYAFKQVCRKFDDFNLKATKLSKNTRYYISNSGGSLYKKSIYDTRITGVNVGFVTTLFNNYIEKPMKDYDINYNFYIKECNKIIDSIENKQLTLF